MATRTISTGPLLEPFERPSAGALACLSVFSSAVRLGFGSVAETKGKGAATCHLPWRWAAGEKRPVLISYLSNKKLLHCEFDCTFLISSQSGPLVVPCLSCLLFCFLFLAQARSETVQCTALWELVSCVKLDTSFLSCCPSSGGNGFGQPKAFVILSSFFWSVVFFSFRGKLQ